MLLWFQDGILPLSATAMALPPASIRGDLGVLLTAGLRYAPTVMQSLLQMGPTKLLQPFSVYMDLLDLKDPFIRNWLDLLCFLLSGLKADGTLSAEIVGIYMHGHIGLSPCMDIVFMML